MAYKVGTTIVIDDSGNVDWSRIANKPAIGTGDISVGTVGNTRPRRPELAGFFIELWRRRLHSATAMSEPLSVAAHRAVTITANRQLLTATAIAGADDGNPQHEYRPLADAGHVLRDASRLGGKQATGRRGHRRRELAMATGRWSPRPSAACAAFWRQATPAAP